MCPFSGYFKVENRKDTCDGDNGPNTRRNMSVWHGALGH